MADPDDLCRRHRKEKTAEENYQPKHLKQYDNSFGHCCFAGCTPMGCEGRCCVKNFFHKASCPSNSTRQWDEAQHDVYVAQGMRKHIAPPPAAFQYSASKDWGALPPLRTRRCGCGDVALYPNGCGPSGCQNRPA